jgi:hypothetical protein
MLADEPEGWISNVFHWSQEQGFIAQEYVTNLYQFIAFQVEGQS